jgi:hypothetical protein
MTISGAGTDRSMTQINGKNLYQTGSLQSRGKYDGGLKAFDEKLRSLEEKDSPFEHAEGEDRSEGAPINDESGMSLAVAPLDIARPALPIASIAGPASANGTIPAQTVQAHLDRMAAAIAEIAIKPGQDAVTVDFADDFALFKSAIVARDASGMIAITMVTPNVAIQPHTWGALRNQLAERLDRRKLGVRSIKLETEKNETSAIQCK